MIDRIAGFQRLRQLPALFRGSDLTLRMGLKSATASQMLWRWKHAELVAPLGGRSDVYANLLVAPQPQWDVAARMAMPSCVVIGIEALRRAGWVTQIPIRPELAAREDRPVYTSIAPFAVETRPASWFEAVRPALPDSGDAAPTLPPAWALADLLVPRGWDGAGLAPDDVDFDLASDSDREQWAQACEALGLDSIELEEAAERFCTARSVSALHL